LPFQFTSRRNQLRMMPNYFAKMPADLVQLLFGDDGLAESLLPLEPEQDAETESTETSSMPQVKRPGGFLEPFKDKADTDYMVYVVGGRRRRGRLHETLVNKCAEWLASQGLEPGRNAAIDLGTQDPRAIIEAKVVGKSWPEAIRAAVGQLYEYRYFKVAEPSARLLFLADKPVPDEWVKYLEQDRRIGCMWRTQSGFRLSPLATRNLHL
jgi:hypothetical protein